MPVVSTSHFSSRLLASNTFGTTSPAIWMFSSNHVFLSLDRGTLTCFLMAMGEGVNPGRSDSWKVSMDGVVVLLIC